MPTVLPFHRAVVSDPAFTGEPFTVHTRWIETEFTGDLPPYQAEPGGAEDGEQGAERERIVVEVGGKRLEVVIPASLGSAGAGSAGTGPANGGRGGAARAGRARPGSGDKARGKAQAASGDQLVSPMQGTIVKIVAADGQRVSAGDPIVVLEAMKMEQPLTAHKDGTVADLAVTIGQTVPAGHVICRLAD
jgi:acetyl-CoA/propionyl-CoA carboxylase biotin carboxyl carrier protein